MSLNDVIANSLATDDTRCRTLTYARLFQGIVSLLIEKGILDKNEVLQMAQEKKAGLVAEYMDIYKVNEDEETDEKKEEREALRDKYIEMFEKYFTGFEDLLKELQ